MTAEQQARDMLERMGVENAQNFTAGDLVELANLIADRGKGDAVQQCAVVGEYPASQLVATVRELIELGNTIDVIVPLRPLRHSGYANDDDHWGAWLIVYSKKGEEK